MNLWPQQSSSSNVKMGGQMVILALPAAIKVNGSSEESAQPSAALNFTLLKNNISSPIFSTYFRQKSFVSQFSLLQNFFFLRKQIGNKTETFVGLDDSYPL